MAQPKVLSDIKKMLGIAEDYNAFDQDLLIHLNTVLVNLKQTGGASEDFQTEITANTSWDDLHIPLDMSLAKTYVFVCVRIIFDPPVSTVQMDSLNRVKKELEWRIIVQHEYDQESL